LNCAVIALHHELTGKMQENGFKELNRFFIAGINYKKTDAAVRGSFAIGQDQYNELIKTAPAFGIHEFFIVSTCNRTEIYGFAEHPNDLVEMICTQTQGNSKTFLQLAYIHKGEAAIRHFFEVGAGLDSQILGDYEIVGQIKQAVKFSKEHGFIGAFTERLVNSMLQSSKAIKNNTTLSGGTVSVSFAAVQYIKENIQQIADKKILLVGTGKIGRNTCKNLVDYLGTTNITLVNRTDSKAAALAAELNLSFASIEDLTTQIRSSDIILVATNAAQPTVLAKDLSDGNKLVIDLSIPANVEATAKTLSNVTLINVDELSKLKDETLQKRQAEVPKAISIIEEHQQEFQTWYALRKHVPVLKAVKVKLSEIHKCPFYQSLHNNEFFTPVSEEHIQKVVNGVATKMRQQQNAGCYYIQAINEYMAIGAN
jgi:glutamyl-tRNA reductase